MLAKSLKLYRLIGVRTFCWCNVNLYYLLFVNQLVCLSRGLYDKNIITLSHIW